MRQKRLAEAREPGDRHPTKVSALVLRAVCLMRTKEVLWLFGDRGIGRLLPDGFHAFSSACDTERKQQQQQQQQPSPPNDDGDEGRFLRWYASALRDELGKDAMARAAAAWSKWEMSVFGRSSQLPPNKLRDLLDGELCELRADDQPPDPRATWAWCPSSGRWECGGVELPEAAVRTALSEDGFSAHIACALSQQAALPMPPRAGVGGAVDRARQFYQRAIEAHVPGGASEDGLTPLSDVAAAAAAAAASRGNASSSPTSLSSGGGWVPVQARLTSTFSEQRAFFASDGELLGLVRAGGASLRRIPCIAVQGGNDIICPPSTAYELHEAWPEMELRVVPAGGHSHYDSGLMAELLRATDAIRDRRHSDTQAEADS